MTEQRKGLLHGVIAYGLWGVAPAFWKLLAGIDAIEVIAHRAVWSLGTFLLLVVLARQLPVLRAALRDLRTLGLMALSGGLLAINWCGFVWATINGHLLEASLGYFINPLLSVALGTLVLRERLSRLQWLAIVLAGAGVAVLTWRAGRVPWISLLLASTFALYGLVRKTARADALVGTTLETFLVAPAAIIYLIAISDHGALGRADASTHVLLVATGIITAVPLILFTSAARRLPLSTIGFLQYLAPTGQFLLAVLAYGEALEPERLFAFAMIWAALVAFSVDLWRAAHRPPRV